MGAKESIRNAMKKKRITYNVLSGKLGIGSQTLLNMVYRDNMTFATVERICDKMDCEIVIRDRYTKEEY